MSVTTAKVAVCSRCGTVLGVEGYYRLGIGGCTAPSPVALSVNQHSVIFVLVVVPYA